ncbi:MAG: heavy metal translocating P-type ATPase [Anaerolineae bacterium]|nr:heavy metal translocating P-type ATPase [Anaerolineae bacterium]
MIASSKTEPIYRSLSWFSRQRLEVILTIVTLCCSLLAYFAGRAALPAATITWLYVLAYLSGGYYGVSDSLTLLRQRTLDVNLLMILAALGAAFIGQPTEGATLLFLFSLSNTLQSFAMDRSRKAISKLLDLRPATASVQRGGEMIILPVEELLLKDLVLVRPGERFPIDGDVVKGTSSVDQATITGESIPVYKEPGDPVFAGTVNGNGALEIRVTHLAADTTLARIVSMVEEAQGQKAKTQRALDRFEQYYAVFVLGASALLILIPYFILSQPFYATFYRAMIWLVVASPCALVISTPASILSAIANGARHGVLFKGGAHLENTAGIKVIAFDKTGTLTTGEPGLTTLIPHGQTSEDELLRLSAAVEVGSEHHLANAILKAAKARDMKLPTAHGFQAVTGRGVQAQVDGQTVLIGNPRLFADQKLAIPDDLQAEVTRLETAGQTVMLVHGGSGWLGLLGVEDTIRPDAAENVAALKRLGIQQIVMLTGDNKRVAAHMAGLAGIDEYHANMLPQDKVMILQALREKYGPVAMVGDGVNDAPALAAADVGIAMGGAGTDVALETADVVLMADSLSHLPRTVGLARKARQVVWQNIAFSIAVIIMLIVGTFGADLPLPLGVIGHEGSTVIVVLNGLRLLGYGRK